MKEVFDEIYEDTPSDIHFIKSLEVYMYINKEESGIGLIEVPNEISVNIVILGCPIHCPECHSKHNWTINKDSVILNYDTLKSIIEPHYKAATVVTFMGGEWESEELSKLIDNIHNDFPRYKICIYSGDENISPLLKSKINYLKLGPYNSKFGGLDSKTTNQRFYKIKDGIEYDITKEFWK